MSKFHALKVSEVRKETEDTVSIAFEVPADLKKDFSFIPGQYLTFRIEQNGEELRRSYSICSSPEMGENLRVAVKKVQNGKMSGYLNDQLEVGATLDTMPPMGNFILAPEKGRRGHYVGIAAGSGITPILSILKSVLKIEEGSKFTLIYSNKDDQSTIFLNELKELEKSFSGRLDTVHVWSRKDTGNPNLNGRLDAQKIKWMLDQYGVRSADHFFLCGPEDLIVNTSDALKSEGIDKSKIHFELFTTPVLLKPDQPDQSANDNSSFEGKSEVTVIMDGIETNFSLDSAGASILDAALDAGADAPFSCKGAVCCTCKAKIVEGKAHMNMNYALTDKEVQDGFILTCQAHPRSGRLIVDFDTF